MKINDLLGEGWRNRDSYQRDYDSSRTGFGKPPREDDEYVNGDQDEIDAHQQHMDSPHDVHINGKSGKHLGHMVTLSNVAKKIKGATVHKSITETATAGATSSASIATVANPSQAYSKKKVKSVSANDQNEVSLFGGALIKRR